MKMHVEKMCEKVLRESNFTQKYIDSRDETEFEIANVSINIIYISCIYRINTHIEYRDR